MLSMRRRFALSGPPGSQEATKPSIFGCATVALHVDCGRAIRLRVAVHEPELWNFEGSMYG